MVDAKSKILLTVVDHSACWSRKNAASCDNRCEMQDTPSTRLSNAHCSHGPSCDFVCLSVVKTNRNISQDSSSVLTTWLSTRRVAIGLSFNTQLQPTFWLDAVWHHMSNSASKIRCSSVAQSIPNECKLMFVPFRPQIKQDYPLNLSI